MLKRGNANTWVLLVLSALIILMGVDIGRKVLWPPHSGPTVPPPSFDPKFKVGDAAPDFTLADAKKGKHSLTDLVKKNGPKETILCFTCGCSQCERFQTYLGELQRTMGDKAPRVLTVSTMMPAREESWVRDTHLKSDFLYVDQKSANVMDLYKGHPCPRAFEIDPKRQVEWISPSMGRTLMPDEIMMETAIRFGFARPGHRIPGGAPEPPPLTPSTKSVIPHT